MASDDRVRAPRQNKTLILVCLGTMLLVPFLWMERGTITLRASVPTSSFAEVVLASKERAADSGLMGENAEQRSLLDAPSSSFLSSRSSLTATSSSGSTRDRNTYSVSSPSLVEFQRTCKAGNEEEVPKLKTLEQWISSKARPRESVTLLTQLSADRMPMLENQCRIWPDPVIAVMFVAIKHNEYDDSSPILVDYPDTTLKDVKRGISSFHAFMETTATCALRIELVGQYVDASNGRTFEYPINSLRNRALDLADTDLVLVLDVDFVASPMLGLPEPGYRDPAVYNQMVDITSRKKAIVLPAFEITNRRQDLVMAQNFARSLVVAGKEEVRSLYSKGEVDQFNGHDAPWGHNPTNTSKWINLTRPLLYRANYEPRYEPFVLLSRQLAPWADERFVGYGGNKIAYINQLHGLNFTFHVHPYGYAVHVPHPRTHASNVFVAQKHRGESAMELLRAKIEMEVESGMYVPVIRNCQERPQEEDDEQRETTSDDVQDSSQEGDEAGGQQGKEQLPDANTEEDGKGKPTENTNEKEGSQDPSTESGKKKNSSGSNGKGTKSDGSKATSGESKKGGGKGGKQGKGAARLHRKH